MPGSRGDVLIVEDSAQSAELLANLVGREGFHPVICDTAADGLAAFELLSPVAVILDWTLPDGPGTELCREIREQDQLVPILFASGRDDETSVVRGLDAGADDYLAKPVRPAELIARLEAHIRRASVIAGPPKEASTPIADQPEPARFGTVEVDFAAREVRVEGRPVRLGALEFKLLEYLSRNAGVAVSRDQILSEVYGYDADISSERVDLLVRRLRSKLGAGAEGHISPVPGYGYRLDRRVGRE